MTIIRKVKPSAVFVSMHADGHRVWAEQCAANLELDSSSSPLHYDELFHRSWASRREHIFFWQVLSAITGCEVKYK